MNRLFLILGTILVFMLLIGVSSIAEEITLTTYYPAPYGVYNELTTTSNTYLATTSGSVGIGTMSPEARLDVNGDIKAVLPMMGGNPMVYNPGQRSIGYDIAELFEANEEVESGDVLSIDENGNLKKSTEAYDFKIAGIVSEAPAILFEGNQLHIAPQPFEFKGGRKPPLALAGRVRCKVATQDGSPIKAGDLLTTSSIPGHAMKATKPGPIVGKALESLESGTGKIMVLVNLGWYGRTE